MAHQQFEGKDFNKPKVVQGVMLTVAERIGAEDQARALDLESERQMVAIDKQDGCQAGLGPGGEQRLKRDIVKVPRCILTDSVLNLMPLSVGSLGSRARLRTRTMWAARGIKRLARRGFY